MTMHPLYGPRAIPPNYARSFVHHRRAMSEQLAPIIPFDELSALPPTPPKSPRPMALYKRIYHNDEDLSLSSRGLNTPLDFLPHISNSPLSSSAPNFPAGGRRASPALWLSLYFTLNLTLTLYNKYTLNHFPFPYTLTAMHALCGAIGSFLILRMDNRRKRWSLRLKPSAFPELDRKDKGVLLLFSVLYTVNIVVSNLSLKLVTIPFHQVVRAVSPIFTMLFSAMLLNTPISRTKLVSLIPVVAGVGFATYGDYYFTAYGLILTLFGTVLASLKTVTTNLLQSSPSASQPTGAKSIFSFPRLSLPKLTLTPLQLLAVLSPLAFVQSLLLAQISGEISRVKVYFEASDGISQLYWLIMNGVTAFLLNIVSFGANGKVGPIGMSVAANVKQVLTILCSVTLFNLTITPMNGLGITLTLLGGAWYTHVELKEKAKKTVA